MTWTASVAGTLDRDHPTRRSSPFTKVIRVHNFHLETDSFFFILAIKHFHSFLLSGSQATSSLLLYTSNLHFYQKPNPLHKVKMRVSAIALLAASAAAAPLADYKHKDTLSVDAAAKILADVKLNARGYESYSEEDLLKLTALLKAGLKVNVRDASYTKADLLKVNALLKANAKVNVRDYAPPSYPYGYKPSKSTGLDLGLGVSLGLGGKTTLGLGLSLGAVVDSVLNLSVDVLAKLGLTLQALLDLDAKLKATLDLSLDALLDISADLAVKAKVDLGALLDLNAKIVAKLGLDVDALLKLNLGLIAKLGLDLDALLDLQLALKAKVDADITLGAGQSIPYGYKYKNGALIDIGATAEVKIALLHILNICLDVNANVSLSGEALKIKAFLDANVSLDVKLALQAALKAELNALVKASVNLKSIISADVLAKLGLKVNARDADYYGKSSSDLLDLDALLKLAAKVNVRDADYYGSSSSSDLLDLDALLKLAAKVNVRDADYGYYGSDDALLDVDLKALLDAAVNL
jgi:hypothetical protein